MPTDSISIFAFSSVDNNVLSALMTSVAIYYETHWKMECTPSTSFLASWQGLAMFSHIMLVIFMPIYAVTTYCILKKTPKSMGSVKWVLLNSHLWCCFMDIMICSLITPYFYFPSLSGFPVGLMTVLGVPTWIQTYVGLVSAMFMAHSLTALFENRSSCIPSNKFRLERKASKNLYYFLNCIVVVLYLMPLFLQIPEQEEAKITVLGDIPCPTLEFFYADVFILTIDTFWKYYLLISTSLMVLFISCQVLFFSSLCIYYLFISTSVTLSTKTKKYQRSFFLGTIVQVFVPFALLLTPVTLAFCSFYLGFYIQELNNSLVLLFSLHGCTADIVILMVHHPYRKFLVKFVICYTKQASWKGLAVFSHLQLIILLPVYTFTTYCILWKTPRSMNSVKLLLLNAHFWSCYTDILMCSLITPYFYFPTISGFPVGLLRTIGVPTDLQTFLGIFSAMIMGTSLVALFENRSSFISSNRFRIVRKSTRILFYIFNLSVILIYIVPPFLNIPEQESARLILLQSIPCPTEEFFYSEVFAFATDHFWKTYLWAATGLMVLFFTIQIGFFSSFCTFYLFISTSITVSSKTKKYQQSFFLGTLTQVVVPLVFLAIPVAVAIFSIYIDSYIQEVNNCVVLFFSLHGLLADVAIVLVHHPYRTFLIELVTWQWGRSTEGQNVSTGMSFVTNSERTAMRRASTRVHIAF